MERLARERFEPREVRVHGGVVQPVVTLHEGLDVIVLHVDDEQAERREIRGRERDQGGAQAQEIEEAAGEEGPGAAEGHQRVVPRIEAAPDAHLPDRVGLVPGRDLQDPLGRAQGIEAEPAGRGRARPPPGRAGSRRRAGGAGSARAPGAHPSPSAGPRPDRNTSVRGPRPRSAAPPSAPRPAPARRCCRPRCRR